MAAATFDPLGISARINEAVVEQHAEGAAFLWLLRDEAVNRAPHFRLADIARLDERVEAHLDGLRIAGDHGWRLCARALELGEPGETFTAAALAFAAGDAGRREQVLAAALTAPPLARALVSAVGWCEPALVEREIRGWLAAAQALLQRLGLAAAAAHRIDPGGRLAELLQSPDPPARARALRSAGELGRADLLRHVARGLADGDAPCRLEAALAAARLGSRDPQVAWELEAAVDRGGADAPRALGTLSRVLAPSAARALAERLAQDAATRTLAARSVGMIGLPELVPALFPWMAQDELARVAGEAFSMVTGVDLAHDDLERDPPEGFRAGPADTADDEDVALDPDEDLPWPDPELVAKRWSEIQARFAPGKRHLLGQPVSPDAARDALRAGFQRQRAAAALELALLQPGVPSFEVRARGSRQRRALAAAG
ncbi:MAG: TIGR02270 family protein [Acidobacteria bacterium]|nr:TIGR02270 family protein [Acidobacteriota bacterium]